MSGMRLCDDRVSGGGRAKSNSLYVEFKSSVKQALNAAFTIPSAAKSDAKTVASPRPMSAEGADGIYDALAAAIDPLCTEDNINGYRFMASEVLDESRAAYLNIKDSMGQTLLLGACASAKYGNGIDLAQSVISTHNQYQTGDDYSRFSLSKEGDTFVVHQDMLSEGFNAYAIVKTWYSSPQNFGVQLATGNGGDIFDGEGSFSYSYYDATGKNFSLSYSTRMTEPSGTKEIGASFVLFDKTAMDGYIMTLSPSVDNAAFMQCYDIVKAYDMDFAALVGAAHAGKTRYECDENMSLYPAIEEELDQLGTQIDYNDKANPDYEIHRGIWSMYTGNAAEITLPESVRSIESTVLVPATLKRINIPKSVRIGNSVMFVTKEHRPAAVEAVTVEAGNRTAYSKDGVVYARSGQILCYPAYAALTDLDFTDGTWGDLPMRSDFAAMNAERITVFADIQVKLESDNAPRLREITVKGNGRFECRNDKISTIVLKDADQLTFSARTSLKLIRIENVLLADIDASAETLTMDDGVYDAELRGSYTKVDYGANIREIDLSNVNARSIEIPDSQATVRAYLQTPDASVRIGNVRAVTELGVDGDIYLANGIGNVGNYRRGRVHIDAYVDPYGLPESADLVLKSLPVLTDFTYEIRGAHAVLTGYTGSQKNVVLPEAVAGYPITEIGESCFSQNKTLETVRIPDSYTKVGRWAFAECNARIAGGANLEFAGEYAFSDVSRLTLDAHGRMGKLLVKAQITDYAAEKGDLSEKPTEGEKPEIPEEPQEQRFIYQMPAGTVGIAANALIYGNAMYDLSGIRYLGVQAVGSDFTNPIDLVYVESKENYGDYQVRYPYIPNAAWETVDGIVYFGSFAARTLSGYSFGNAITIRAGTKGIASNFAQIYDPSISWLLPQGLVYIGDQAFSNFGTLNIPASVTSIGDAYRGWMGGFESKVNVECTRQDVKWDLKILSANVSVRYGVAGGLTYMNAQGTFRLKDNFKASIVRALSAAIPATVTVDGAVYTVDEIGEEAYRGVIKDAIIGDPYKDGFGFAPGGTVMSVPSSVRYIGAYAFADCDIMEFTVPSGLDEFGYGVLRESNFGTLRLKGNRVESGARRFPSSWLKAGKIVTLFLENMTSIDSLTVRDLNFNEIVLPDNLVRIENNTDLRVQQARLIIPASVRFIGDYAIGGVQNVYIPAGVSKVGAQAFFVGSEKGNSHIYCAAPSRPGGWSDQWCYNYAQDDPRSYTVHWGAAMPA